MDKQDQDNIEYASLNDRYSAVFLDGIVIIGMMFLVAYSFNAIDVENAHIYFSNRTTNSIERVNFDGSGLIDIHKFSLTIKMVSAYTFAH